MHPLPLSQTSLVRIGWKRLVVFSIEKTNQRLKQRLYVVAAVVAKFHQKVKQPQNLGEQIHIDKCR